MKYADFKSALAERITEPLAARGFKETAKRSFVRAKPTHEINVISFQKHSVNSSICINLGVHYDFLPRAGQNKAIDLKKISDMDCEIRKRLTPDPSQVDYWWPINSDSIEEVVILIINQTDAYFSRFDIDGEISTIEPEDMRQEIPELLSWMSDAGACLLLARMHEVFGNIEKAADFARYGIDVSGVAVEPRVRLKELLKRVGMSKQ